MVNGIHFKIGVKPFDNQAVFYLELFVYFDFKIIFLEMIWEASRRTRRQQ